MDKKSISRLKVIIGRRLTRYVVEQSIEDLSIFLLVRPTDL